MSLLPIPLIKFFPKIFKNDDKAINLASKIETNLLTWKNDIIELNRFFRPDEVMERFLTELNFYLEAGMLNQDTELIKRKKARDAISQHKIRGTWQADAKIRIDNITGLSPGSRIFRSTGTADWILVGDGTTPTDFYWASMGADGIDLDLGLDLIGEGTEIEIAGNIFIDLHEGVNTDVLTAEQIAHIVTDLETDVVPAYFIVNLGYVNVTGQFIIYSGGIIS
jgi:hypothetical protein